MSTSQWLLSANAPHNLNVCSTSCRASTGVFLRRTKASSPLSLLDVSYGVCGYCGPFGVVVSVPRDLSAPITSYK